MLKLLASNERGQRLKTGIPFHEDLASSMADVTAGRDNDVSLIPNARSLDCNPLKGPESETVREEGTIGGINVQTPEIVARTTKRERIPSDPAMKLEFELREYVQAKTQFLLSQIHDDGTVGKIFKVKLDSNSYPKRSYNWTDEEPREYIVLKNDDGKKKRLDIVVNYNENLDEKLKELYGNHRTPEVVQKGNCDGDSYLRLLLSSPFQQARTLEKPECQVGTDTEPKSKLAQNKELEPKAKLAQNKELEPESKLVTNKELELDNRKPKRKDFVEEPPKEPVYHAEQQERREKKMARRKMYRWERWIADNPHFLGSGSPPNKHNVESRKKAFDIPETRQERRERLTDSLFQDDSKKFVHYVDSISDVVQPLVPVLTAAALVRGTVPEIHPSLNCRPEEVKLDIESHEEPEENCEIVLDEKINQTEKSSKKDKKKKKKKRKSSSSSDDLETLEKISEARLGLRK